LLALKLLVVRFFLFRSELVVVVLGANQYLLDLSVVYQRINDLNSGVSMQSICFKFL
jgi:hypothetical protein